MKSLIFRLDFLGMQEKLRINLNKHFQTLVGGLLSLCIFLLCFIAILCYIIDLFAHDNPFVMIESKEISQSQYNLTLDKSGIELFLSISDSNHNYLNDETIVIVNAIISQVNFISLNNVTTRHVEQKKIKMTKCSDFYSIQEIQKYNIFFPHENFYCLTPNIKFFYSDWGNDDYRKLTINIERCSNDTLQGNEQSCKSIDIINQTVNKGFINFITTDYLLNHKNYSNPLEKILINKSEQIIESSTLNYALSYSNILYKTFFGIIFTDYDIKSSPFIEEFSRYYTFGDKNNIARINLEANNLILNVKRSYIKFQDLLINFGGLANSLVLIGTTLNYLNSYSFNIIDNVLLNHNTNLDYCKPNDSPKKSKIPFLKIEKSPSNFILNIHKTDATNINILNSNPITHKMRSDQEVNKNLKNFNQDLNPNNHPLYNINNNNCITNPNIRSNQKDNNNKIQIFTSCRNSINVPGDIKRLFKLNQLKKGKFEEDENSQYLKYCLQLGDSDLNERNKNVNDDIPDFKDNKDEQKNNVIKNDHANNAIKNDNKETDNYNKIYLKLKNNHFRQAKKDVFEEDNKNTPINKIMNSIPQINEDNSFVKGQTTKNITPLIEKDFLINNKQNSQNNLFFDVKNKSNEKYTNEEYNLRLHPDKFQNINGNKDKDINYNNHNNSHNYEYQKNITNNNINSGYLSPTKKVFHHQKNKQEIKVQKPKGKNLIYS